MKPVRALAGYFFILAAAVLAATVLAGCGGGGGGPSGGSSGPPEIDVSTTQLDFGGIVAGGTPANFTDRTITVRNTGTGNLTVSQVSVSAQAAAAYVVPPNLDQCSGQVVGPNGSCTVAARFQPPAQGDFNFPTGLTLSSNDSDEASVTVALSGRGRGLNVSINRVDTTDCGATPALLRLFVSVTDANGNPVSTLIEDPDFTIIEDLTVISHPYEDFQPPPTAGTLAIGLALDYSLSVTEDNAKLDRLKEAARLFIDQLAVDDEAEIIKFSEQIFPVLDYTTNKSTLKAAIDADFTGVSAGTSLFDAAIAAVDRADAFGRLRRAVLVVSDGEETTSGSTLTAAIDNAVQRGVPIFTIAISEIGVENMQRLADETGGQFFFAADPSQVSGIYTKINQLLSNQYVITYQTRSTGGGPVSIEVQVDDSVFQGEDTKDANGC
jgi:VWFA-related protein